MKILNAMFSKGLGGIEQAFLDYSNALTQAGHKVVQVIHKHGETIKYVKGDFHPISNFSKYDPFTIIRLKKIISLEKPDCIITHGNRAAKMLQFAANKTPIISLCHNYSFKQLFKSDAIITVSEDLNHQIKEKGYKRVYTIPNMIDMEDKMEPTNLSYQTTPVVGTMGRFVKKKGFEVFLKALAILKGKNIDFKGVIGGDGEEKGTLEKVAKEFALEDKVEFTGWIKDKEKFYKNIDIFCLPSLHEPFGIVILEAFKYSRPVISSKTEGPSNIITDRHNGLFTEIDNPEDLANKIEELLKDQEFAQRIAQEGFQSVETKYNSKIVTKQITNTINNVIKHSK